MARHSDEWKFIDSGFLDMQAMIGFGAPTFVHIGPSRSHVLTIRSLARSADSDVRAKILLHWYPTVTLQLSTV